MATQPREVLFEFRQIGTIVKVTAVDAITGTEVCIQGPAGAGEAVLKQNALKKLDYVMKKETEKTR